MLHLLFLIGLAFAALFISDTVARFWRHRNRPVQPLRQHRAGATRILVDADWWPDGMQAPDPGWLDRFRDDSLTSSAP